MPIEPDPYRTLGLTRGASLDEVKRAYRRLAKVNHPDAAGPAALSRFLAIQAAYEQLAGSSAGPKAAGPAAPGARQEPRRPANPARDREAGRTQDGSGARSRAGRTGGTGRPGTSGQSGTGARSGTSGQPRPDAGARSGTSSRPGPSRAGGGPPGEGGASNRGARGKATLGSTSYDGADSGPFEPDWGGASWYGTTSGTYWTINPKEYADPRKHGPEYQARARRTTGGRGAAEAADETAGPEETAETADDEPIAGPPWEDDLGGSRSDGSPRSASRAWSRGSGQTVRDRFARASGARRTWSRDDPVPDPTRAAIDLGRALTDPHSGGFKGRVVRAVIGWIPIALGIGWLVGELTGCGRFAATCDPSVLPLTAVGQTIVLVALLVVPEVAAIAAGASLGLLGAAVFASLILSATGAAADEASRRTALGALLVVSWISGLAIAIVRRLRSGPRTPRPVS